MTRAVVVHCTRQKYDVYIGRPSVWGNPFIIGPDGDRKRVIARYREWFMAQPRLQKLALAQLVGKRLGCWCRPGQCHGDILAEFVNSRLLDAAPCTDTSLGHDPARG